MQLSLDAWIYYNCSTFIKLSVTFAKTSNYCSKIHSHADQHLAVDKDIWKCWCYFHAGKKNQATKIKAVSSACLGATRQHRRTPVVEVRRHKWMWKILHLVASYWMEHCLNSLHHKHRLRGSRTLAVVAVFKYFNHLFQSYKIDL